MSKQPTYDESSIQSLDWKQHIRQRPGMYIGKLGNGKSSDDGIYVLLKEILDNSIDEYIMGYGKKINIKTYSFKNSYCIIKHCSCHAYKYVLVLHHEITNKILKNCIGIVKCLTKLILKQSVLLKLITKTHSYYEFLGSFTFKVH